LLSSLRPPNRTIAARRKLNSEQQPSGPEHPLASSTGLRHLCTPARATRIDRSELVSLAAMGTRRHERLRGFHLVSLSDWLS
jgi:hypothetical protein